MKKIISIAVTIIAIVSVLLINIANKLDKIKINSEVYLYNFNEKIELNNPEIKYYKEKSTLKNDQETLELSSQPIYYKNDKRLFLPKDVSIVNYETGQIKKINHFSEIVEEYKHVYLDYYGEKSLLSTSFLYDGEDTYVFLEETTINLGEREFKIEPFSYLKMVNNNSEMQVYLRESDKYFTLDVTDIKVKAISNYGYEIDLKLDILKTIKGEQLLFKNIQSLSNY